MKITIETTFKTDDGNYTTSLQVIDCYASEDNLKGFSEKCKASLYLLKDLTGSHDLAIRMLDHENGKLFYSFQIVESITEIDNIGEPDLFKGNIGATENTKQN